MMNGITNSMDITFSKLQETVKDREAWSAAVHGITELDMTEQQPMKGGGPDTCHLWEVNRLQILTWLM